MAWVHINSHYNESNPKSYYEYGKAEFDNCVFEEGALYAVWARPFAGKKLEDVIVRNCLSAPADLGSGIGKAFYFFDVKNAVVEHSQVGWHN